MYSTTGPNLSVTVHSIQKANARKAVICFTFMADLILFKSLHTLAGFYAYSTNGRRAGVVTCVSVVATVVMTGKLFV